MAGYVMKMSILVPNISRCGQKELSFKVRHKAYACPLCLTLKRLTVQKKTDERMKKNIIFAK